uniref:Uncharacterized protein n=1 Tax=Leersia perrieri TaxID=77586 RepID=A0A0D9VY56_9ORYZ
MDGNGDGRVVQPTELAAQRLKEKDQSPASPSEKRRRDARAPRLVECARRHRRSAAPPPPDATPRLLPDASSQDFLFLDASVNLLPWPIQKTCNFIICPT